MADVNSSRGHVAIVVAVCSWATAVTIAVTLGRPDRSPTAAPRQGGTTTATPRRVDVTGKTIAEGVRALKQNGWRSGDVDGDGYVDDYSWAVVADQHADWIVCDQEYESRVDGTFSVSLGAAPTSSCSVSVPNVLGKTDGNAARSARAVGLILDEDAFKNEVTSAWVVCAQSPSAGRRVNPAKDAILSVSVAPSARDC